jgi:hypothetical protein
MEFKQWLLTEKAIPITEDMFRFAAEVMDIVKQWNGPDSFRMFRVFHQRDVDFGEYGRKFVQVRAAPMNGPGVAQADGNLVTIFVTRWGTGQVDEKIIAHELVHVIDPRLNMKAGRRQAYNDLYAAAADASGVGGDDIDRFIRSYYNTRHEFLAYRSSDAYSFVNDLARNGYDAGRAKAEIQKLLLKVRGKFKRSWWEWLKDLEPPDDPKYRSTKHMMTGAKNYAGGDEKVWQKYASAYAQAFQDIYGNPRQSPTY